MPLRSPTGAGLRDEFERLLSVEEAGVWKPADAAYAYAARVCGVRPEEMLLVAVHLWDIDGARRPAWVNRTGTPYPNYFTAPTVAVSGLSDLARRIGT